MSRDLVLEEGTGVYAAIGEGKSTLSVFLPILVVAIVAGTIRPGLHALPVLLIFEPIAYVRRSIRMLVRALSVCFIVEPLAFVDITIGVYQCAKSIRLVVLPVALVARAVGPHLRSIAMLFPKDSLTIVSASISVSCWSHVDLIVRFVSSRGHPALRRTSSHVFLPFRLMPILNLDLLLCIIDVCHILVLLAVFLLDRDLAFVVWIFRDAVPSAISHFYVSDLRFFLLP